ncbi:DUF6221 family protein [Streptomyces sp. NRRL F-2580]|uniref:DUF6221 family protein n=1 Tax=Streptomyces sp. NRRL F-2580 TaxID=1463841 RepID=UPI0007C5CBF6|nr:DUF6221 family protein [Streptomyces sp. NRRL F-2580]
MDRLRIWQPKPEALAAMKARLGLSATGRSRDSPTGSPSPPRQDVGVFLPGVVDDDPLALADEGVTAMRRGDFPVMMEFFRARLREDETAARAVKPGKDEGTARLQARVLADVAAKRRLMHWVEEYPRKAEDKGSAFLERVVARTSLSLRSPVIYELVAAYADHPDFRPEWLPIEGEQELDEECEAGAYESSARRRGRTV